MELVKTASSNTSITARPGVRTSPDPAETLRFLHALWQRGEVRELRILHFTTRHQTASGYFDAPEKRAFAARKYDKPANIYLTLNPVLPDLIARASNRIVEKAERTTSDAEVVCRVGFWLISTRSAQLG